MKPFNTNILETMRLFLVNIAAEPFLDAFLVNLEDLTSNITWRACSLITLAFTLRC